LSTIRHALFLSLSLFLSGIVVKVVASRSHFQQVAESIVRIQDFQHVPVLLTAKLVIKRMKITVPKRHSTHTQINKKKKILEPLDVGIVVTEHQLVPYHLRNGIDVEVARQYPRPSFSWKN
jgi:hypothetical protein